MGLNHVLDFNAYDHILFLIVLAVIFSFNKFKKVLYLVTLFTIGHSITLALAAFGVLSVNMKLVEFLIPVTIFITGTVNVFTAKQAASGKDKINLVLALLFGFIHGLGFSNYFNMMIGRGEDKIIPLLEFSLGIEAAQIIIVVGILLIGTVLQNFLKVNKRDWILVCSSIVIGFAIQMMLNRIFW
jgi:hypothetical protein